MELLLELTKMNDALKVAKPHVNAIAKTLFKQSADWVKDLKRSKEAKYYGVVDTESTLVDHRGKPLRLTFDNSTDSGEFEINSLAPLMIKKGSEVDLQIKKLYKDYKIDSSKKTNYIVRHGDSVLREIHIGKHPNQNTVDFTREVLSLLKKPESE